MSCRLAIRHIIALIALLVFSTTVFGAGDDYTVLYTTGAMGDVGRVAYIQTVLKKLSFVPNLESASLSISVTNASSHLLSSKIYLASLGNLFYPGAMGVLDNGEMIASCYSHMGYSVCGVGPMDFMLGTDVIRERAKCSSFPLISTNILWKAQPFSSSEFENIVKSLLQNLEDELMVVPDEGSSYPLMPVAILGKDNPVAFLSFIDIPRIELDFLETLPIKIYDPIVTMKDAVEILKAQNVKNICILAFSRTNNAVEMMKTEGVSVVICDETAFSGGLVSGVNELRTRNGGLLCLGQNENRELGRIDFTPSTKDSLARVRSYSVNKTIKPDKELQKIVKHFEQEQRTNYSSEITTLSAEAAGLFPDLCAEVVRERAKTEASFLLYDLFRRGAKEGAFTELDFWRIMPAGDSISTLEVNGRLLEDLALNHRDTLYSSGVDTTGGVTTINGRRVKRNRIYKIAVNSYVARGVGGYIDRSSNLVSRIRHTGLLIQDVVKKYLMSTKKPSLTDFRYLWRKPVYTGTFDVSATVERVSINDQVPLYADEAVPGMSDSSKNKLKSNFALGWLQESPSSDVCCQR